MAAGALPTVANAAVSRPGEVQQSELERAAASGEPVEVVAERTEYAQTLANPDGTFTLTQSTTPQRVKSDSGGWVEPDATLVKRADGRIEPKAVVADLSFAGGGDGQEMVRLAVGDKAVELGWPGQLPEPVLDGATATYPEVLAGVDLQLTATTEGYREVLVVKTAQAAENPKLENIQLSASGTGLEIVPGAGGGLRALDEDANAVFKGPAAVMWDSAGADTDTASPGVRAMFVTEDAPGSPSGDGDAAQEDAPQTQPGDGDATAVMPVAVTADTVGVKPDLELLRGAERAFGVDVLPHIS
ncbi:hypothetical protein NLX86_33365 [Streptomyces sp. A3M-1-3]|uniref:hypothetical protein n=1 Tax=Streptomyces sp. A3M-1-3 TaxID=2962044 RepID=UPI0020B66A82|nr:hypothetical protein [Streptomyces sp. A3M-1-3]MCP3822794.1 hypothetical protein [Streptomyces sp. A3M-1-3]